MIPALPAGRHHHSANDSNLVVMVVVVQVKQKHSKTSLLHSSSISPLVKNLHCISGWHLSVCTIQPSPRWWNQSFAVFHLQANYLIWCLHWHNDVHKGCQLQVDGIAPFLMVSNDKVEENIIQYILQWIPSWIQDALNSHALDTII